MTTLKEIINFLRNNKAKEHYNPSMDGKRDAKMEGKKEAYLDCADILEKYLKQTIDENEIIELQCDCLAQDIENGTMEKDLNRLYPHDDQSWVQGYAVGFERGVSQRLKL